MVCYKINFDILYNAFLSDVGNVPTWEHGIFGYIEMDKKKTSNISEIPLD